MDSKNSSYGSAFPRLCAVRFFSVFELCAAGTLIGAAVFHQFDQLLWLPLLLASAMVLAVVPAGFLADHFPKRTGMIIGVLGELLVLLAILWGRSGEFSCGGGVVLFFLMCFAFAQIPPSMNGFLPDLFHEKQLSRCNGIMTFWWFLGMISGGGTGFLLSLCNASRRAAGTGLSLLLFAVGVIAFIVALHVPLVCPPASDRLRKSGVLRDGLREIRRKGSHLYAVLGDAMLMIFCCAMPLLLSAWCRDRFNVTDIHSESLILLPLVMGVVIGALLAGALSKQKIEMGLIPFSSACIGAGFLLMVLLPGESISATLNVPWMKNPVSVSLYLQMSVWLLLGGAGIGLLLIPLHSYCQMRYRSEIRGSAMAVAQGILGVMVLIAGGIMLFIRNFTTGPLEYLTPANLIVGFSMMAVLLTLITMWCLPDMVLRFITITLGRMVYHIRVQGAENIPEQGPALLVSNHVSLIDSILISTCTSRRIRFLMTEDFLDIPLIRSIARMTGFIVVPGPGCGRKRLVAMINSVRNALKKGEIICVFPEESPTENSVTGPFKNGFTHMLPEDVAVPLIPICIGGMWGSRYSRTRSLVGHPIVLRKNHNAFVAIGKPMPPDATAFQTRQAVTRLAADFTEKNFFPGEQPLHAMFTSLAKRHPLLTILRDSDGKSLSAFKILVASLLLSRELRQLHDHSDYVGMLLPNCSAAALSILGILFADKIPCPLNFTTPQPVFDRTIAKTGIRKIITSRKFLNKLHFKPEPEQCVYIEDVVKSITPFKKICILLAAALLPGRELLGLFSPRSSSDPGQIATVLFSSGTTGDPKGVCLTHHNFYSDMVALAELISYDPLKDGFVGNLPLFHSFGLTVCLWIPLVTGCRTTYMLNPLDGEMMGKLIERDHLTMLFATPSFLQTYMRKCSSAQLRSLRLAVTGAERLRPDVAKQFSELCENRLMVTEGYGCTELSPVVSVNVPDQVTGIGKEIGKAGSIGPAISVLSAKIVDPITYKELPPNSEGLLFVRGPIVMAGYLNDPEKTSQVMFDGYYNTGDIATMDVDGRISICGRLSRFSKISGEMVPHEMVENIINELCHTTAQVAAVGSIPDPRKGEALAVIYTPEMPLTPNDVVNELRERSISNLWIPKVVNFYPVDELPRLGSGKLDLMKLKQILEEVGK